MTLTAIISLSTKLVFGIGSTAYLGLELASMGARGVGVVTDQRTKNLASAILESLKAVNRKVVGVFECDRLDLDGISGAVKALDGCDAIVSVGGWLQTSLSMYVCYEVGALHVAIPAPPGMGAPMLSAPVPPKGCTPPPRRFNRPVLVVVDPELVSVSERDEVTIEAAVLCAKAIACRRTNYFAGKLARCAIEELKKALSCGSFEHLCFSVVLSGLANGLLNCSATMALARALHALYGIDPYSAELAVLPAWLARVLESHCALGDDREALSELAWVQAFLQSVSLPKLSQLGLKARALDLVVEYAWTFDHYYIESDPVASDKYALRELLSEAMCREDCRD